MSQLSTSRTTADTATTHVNDHNEIHRLHNIVDLGFRLTPTATKTANYTAVANDLVICDLTSGAFAVTLPTAPADGTRVGIRRLNTGPTYSLTLSLGGADTFETGASSFIYPLPQAEAIWQYQASGTRWVQQSSSQSLGQMRLEYWQSRTTDKTTGYTAAAGDLVSVDTTSNAVTVTLPTAPPNNTTIGVKLTVKPGVNICTVATGGTDGFEYLSGATTYSIANLYQTVIFRYNVSGAIWTVVSDYTGAFPWKDYTPALVQSASVTHSVTSARYKLTGSTMLVALDITATGAGTATAKVSVGLPSLTDSPSGYSPVFQGGGAGVLGTGQCAIAGTVYKVIAQFDQVASNVPYVSLLRTDTTGNGVIGSSAPTNALANTDRFILNLTYEVTPI